MHHDPMPEDTLVDANPSTTAYLDHAELVSHLVAIRRQLQWLMREVARTSNRQGRMQMDINDLQVQADKELAALTDETNIVANVRTVVDNQNAKIAKLQVDLNAALAAQVPSPSGPVVSAEAIQKLSDTLNAMQLASTANANAVAAAVVAGTELAAPPATDPVVTDPPVAGDPPAAADPTTTKTSDPAG